MRQMTQMTLNPTRSNVPHICINSVPDSNFTPFRSDQPFSRYRPFKNMCTKWPHKDLDHYNVKGTWHMLLMSQSPKISLHFLLRVTVYKVVDSRKSTKWPQNDLEHITVKSTLHTLNTYLRGPFFSVLLYDQLFSSTSLPKIGNIGNAPNDLKRLTVKYTLYTLSIPQDPNCRPYCSTTSLFKIQDCQKSKMYHMTLDFEILSAKGTSYALSNYPRVTKARNYVRFALRPVVFEIQSCQKWGKAPKDPQITLNSQKYLAHTK